MIAGSGRDLYLCMKYRNILKMVEKDGWRLVSQEGSHRQFKHPVKRGRVTIAGHSSKEAAPGTLNSILKQAGLK
jgi:predicted RNA binding protein YcfA (HicA-like mRNA interferase family)